MVGLQCVVCDRMYPARRDPGGVRTCPRCGEAGILDVQYDYRAVGRRLTRRAMAARADQSQWRYREVLPVGAASLVPSLAVGGTPLSAAPVLARHLGIGELLVKDEGRNATGSLKDRASALGVVKAREARRTIIACASTGNAASSCAGMAASMGLRSVIFVPANAPEPKIAQLLIFGATVLRVRGGYEQAYRLCQQACERWGWYNRNAALNPYLVEGKKTAGWEIAEQMGWDAPDWVAVPVGDGCTIAGVWKAFRECQTLGLIGRLPRMLGVQPAGAASLTEAFFNGEPPRAVEPNTVADSIAVSAPRNWQKALRAVSESGGAMLTVEDAEIAGAMRDAGRMAGIFAEPAAAAAIAGLRRAAAEGLVGKRARAVAIVTGNGLKNFRAARAAAGEPFEIAADGDGIEEVLRRREVLKA